MVYKVINKFNNKTKLENAQETKNNTENYFKFNCWASAQH